MDYIISDKDIESIISYLLNSPCPSKDVQQFVTYFRTLKPVESLQGGVAQPQGAMVEKSSAVTLDKLTPGGHAEQNSI